jgi:hypothetical protein
MEINEMKSFTPEYEMLVAETKLCKRGIEAAKKKYKKYPSAYANGYAVQVCKGMQPDNKGSKKKSWNEDLDKWFKEKWVDIGASKDGKHPECGRPDADHPNRKYPKCVPAAKAAQMTKQEKSDASKRKRSGGQGKGKAPKYVSTE